jgi:hypothetical protein
MMAVTLVVMPMSYLINLCNNGNDPSVMRVRPAQRQHEVSDDTRDARATAGCQRDNSNDAYVVGQTKCNDGKDASASGGDNASTTKAMMPLQNGNNASKTKVTMPMLRWKGRLG